MTTSVMDQTERARRFYLEGDGGEAAAAAYVELMDREMWFHGDPRVEQAGGSAHDARIAMLRLAAQHLDLAPGRLLVEVGAGVGGAAVRLAEMTGASVVGMSNVDSLNARARALAADLVAAGRLVPGRVSFVTTGNEDYRWLPAWSADSVDAVLFMESVCHLPDPQDLFSAAFRVLRPGGRLWGMDWLRRPWGSYQTPAQLAPLVAPVVTNYRLEQLGTLGEYTAMIRAAGFTVEHAVDLYADELCLGTAEPPEAWLGYQGPSRELMLAGWQAMHAARAAGVFTVGWWSATKPA